MAKKKAKAKKTKAPKYKVYWTKDGVEVKGPKEKDDKEKEKKPSLWVPVEGDMRGILPSPFEIAATENPSTFIVRTTDGGVYLQTYYGLFKKVEPTP